MDICNVFGLIHGLATQQQESLKMCQESVKNINLHRVDDINQLRGDLASKKEELDHALNHVEKLKNDLK